MPNVERAVWCFVFMLHIALGSRAEFDADTYTKLLSR